MKIDILKPSEIPETWRNQVLGLDIETEDDSPFPPISTVQLYHPKEKRSIIVPVHVIWHNAEYTLSADELEILKGLLKTIKAVGHNLQFDLSILLHNWGVEVFPKFDTFLMARVLQLEEQALKPLLIRLHPEYQSQLTEWSSLGFTSSPWTFDLDDARQVQYAGLDPYLPFILGVDFKDRIAKNKKAIDLENSYLRVCIRQRANGLLVDTDEYEKGLAKTKEELDEKQSQLNEMAGFSCRPNSSADLNEFLINRMGITPTQLTPKGNPAFNGDALEMMLDNEKNSPEKARAVELVQEVKTIKSVYGSLTKVPEKLISLDE